MAYEIEEGEVGTILVDDSLANRKKVWNKLIKFFQKHGAYCGGSVIQCDDPQIEAPEVLGDIADLIFKTKEGDEK